MKIGIEFVGITDAKQNQLHQWCNNNSLWRLENNSQDTKAKDYVVFKNNNTAFLLAHGSKEGYIQLRGELYTPQAVVNWLAPIAEKQGIKKVFSLCCYGGVQPEVCAENGVVLKSFHPSHEPVQICPLLESVEFIFDVTPEEAEAWILPGEERTDYDISVYKR